MDMGKLRLTDAEILNILKGPYFGLGHPEVADAATAKALWGLVDWLETGGKTGVVRSYHVVGGHLIEVLEAAGIPRPESIDAPII